MAGPVGMTYTLYTMSHDNEVDEGGDPDVLVLPCPGQSVSREDHEFQTFKLTM